MYMGIGRFNPFQIKKSYLFLILGGILIIWMLFFDTYSFWTRYSLNERKQELIHKTRQLKQESAQLKTKIENLKNDTSLLKRLAREKYGMRKKGETVYKVKTEE